MANPLFPPRGILHDVYTNQLEIISISEKVSEADCINYRSLTISSDYLFAQSMLIVQASAADEQLLANPSYSSSSYVMVHLHNVSSR